MRWAPAYAGATDIWFCKGLSLYKTQMPSESFQTAFSFHSYDYALLYKANRTYVLSDGLFDKTNQFFFLLATFKMQPNTKPAAAGISQPRPIS